MKFRVFIILPTVLLLLQAHAYSWNKAEAEKTIEEATEKLYSIDNNYLLSPYIPYKAYSNAITNVIIAKKHFETDDYNAAYFYSKVAIIELESVLISASAREYAQKKIRLELDHYKGLGYIKNILDANLHINGNALKIELPDREIFTGKGFTLNLYGTETINKIIAILKTFPDSKVKIVGHTSAADKNDYSKQKAAAVMKYFITQGIQSDRASSEGLGNREVLYTPLGYMRIDRIEIIVSGIDL